MADEIKTEFDNPRTILTLRDVIHNPPGWNSRQIAARYMIRDALEAKYKAAILDQSRKKRFKLAVYRHTDDEYTAHIKVPSEKYEVDYDVILRITFPEGVNAIMNADIRLYTNSPSWIFVQGYVYTTRGFLYPGFEPLLGLAATEPPTKTNSAEDTGFDKVVQQAILFMTGFGGILRKSDLAIEAGRLTNKRPPSVTDTSLSATAKMLEYENAKRKYADEKRAERAAEKGRKELEKTQSKRDRHAAAVAKRHGTKKTSTGTSAKTTRSVGTTKSVKRR